MIRLAALLLALLAAAPVSAETPDQVARRYGLAGELLVARGDRVLLDRGYGTVDPRGGAVHRAGERWRLASITKQVTAALVLRDLPPAMIDAPVFPLLEQRADVAIAPDAGYPPLGDVTVRQLLTHHSGLANPDDGAGGADGVPAFYRPGGGDKMLCWSQTSVANAPFSYNNCDYLMLGALMDRIGLPLRWPAGMAMATPGERGVPGFLHGAPEPAIELANWGAAGGLTGTARAVLDFDRSLMTGRFLAAPLRTALWTPEGNGSYQALGQWVFPGRLKGCAALKRIVQRDGEIWGVQARNYILPDDDLVVIVFTNRSADDFALGEVWEGKGFTYDLLSAAVAC